jgi:hypothetical protein
MEEAVGSVGVPITCDYSISKMLPIKLSELAIGWPCSEFVVSRNWENHSQAMTLLRNEIS